MQVVSKVSGLPRKNGKRILPPNREPKSFQWNVEQYYQMYDLGFFQGRRVELIRGEIIEMSPMKSTHMVAIQLMNEVLRVVFGKGYMISMQMPLRLSDTNEPEPDIAVVKGQIRDFVETHPNRAELIVEVSETTLRFDRGKKASLYAQHGIEDYWIINIKDRQVEVNRQPAKNAEKKAYYAEQIIYREDQSISPLAKPKSKIKVADILP